MPTFKIRHNRIHKLALGFRKMQTFENLIDTGRYRPHGIYTGGGKRDQDVNKLY